MRDIIIKAYGLFDSNKNQEVLTSCLAELHELCSEWYLPEDAFSLDKGFIEISYEGDYFPHEEVVAIFAKYINEESTGKLDLMDLEAWTLERFFFDFEHNKIHFEKEGNKRPYARKSSLNHALENAKH